MSEVTSYQKACDILLEWDVDLSSSFIAKTSEQFEETQQELSEARLLELAEQPLSQSQAAPRVWMIEADGMMIPTRGENQEISGCSVYKEVKTVIFYLKNTPSQRFQVSTTKQSSKFAALVHGLMRFAGIRQNDLLVGLADGARWIGDLFGDLGVNKHILDVFHAASYFETLLLSLGWSETQRQAERASLLRGEFNMQAWLNWNVLPKTRVQIMACAALASGSGHQRLPKEALAYLENQSLLGRMEYRDFKADGFEVIGSGEIEGINKSVLAARLRISGARWGCGGDGKAFARGMSASVRQVMDFDSVRLTAFPKAA